MTGLYQNPYEMRLYLPMLASIIQNMPDDNHIPLPSIELRLAAAGVQDLPQAGRNLELLRSSLGPDAFEEQIPKVLASLGAAADPDLAINHLERLVSNPDDASLFLSLCAKSPSALPELLTLFGASRFLSLFFIAHAHDMLVLLSDPAYLTVREGKDRMAHDLDALLPPACGEQDLLRTLRIFRRRELIRIALRDLLERADCAETTAALSYLAEVCLQASYVRILDELTSRFGRPMTAASNGTSPAGFAVIAMGKLGGRELNFSSDIDLMYVYNDEGETEGSVAPGGGAQGRISNHEFFVKLAEKLTAAIGRSTEDGFVFRVDLRLRPEGQRGPLAQTLSGYEIYYESWGQAWERAALIKARPAAGDPSVGAEFLTRITPFVFRKYLDYGAIVEIREMKEKINREVRQKGREHRDVKLGYGGIREIEFLVQALQLIYGGRDGALRERNTIKALHLLAQKGLLTYEENADLARAYVFLRTVEHRIQLLDDLQSQTMPQDQAGLRTLARRAGYRTQGGEIDALLRDYVRHTDRVRNIYDALLSQTSGGPAAEGDASQFGVLLDPDTGEREALPVLARYGFRDPAKAYRDLLLLREGAAFVHQTPRSRKLFSELFPGIFGEIIGSPDPDMALNHLESFLAGQGSWEAFQAFAKQDPRIVKALIAVFANSEYFSRMLVRSPHLLEDVLDNEKASGLGAAEKMRRDLGALLRRTTDLPEKLDVLRRFKHREEMRIGMADLLSDISSPLASRSLSRLAETCLGAALTLAAAEIGGKYGIKDALTGLAVIGAGKLGGRELTYGSDLDILFVYSEERSCAPPPGLTVFELFSKVAEKTISYLTTMTREGFVYRVDTRLRPTGSKGSLVQSIEAFRSYYADQAETWERQALVNGRFVAGDSGVGREFIGTIEGLIYRRTERAILAADIRAMRKRMEEELGKEDSRRYNIKQGVGGIVDIEFVAQFLQLVHGHERRRIRVPGVPNAFRALKREGLLPAAEHRMLLDAYVFLRMLESRMRIVTNQASSELSRDPKKLLTLARRFGYEDDALGAGEKLLRDYERRRKEVREAFERTVR